MRTNLIGLGKFFSDESARPVHDILAELHIGRKRRQEQRESEEVVLDLECNSRSRATSAEQQYRCQKLRSAECLRN